jgi:hypothetical protein
LVLAGDGDTLITDMDIRTILITDGVITHLIMVVILLITVVTRQFMLIPAVISTGKEDHLEPM